MSEWDSVEVNALMAALWEELRKLGERIMKHEISIEEAMREIERIAEDPRYDPAFDWMEQRAEEEVAKRRRPGVRW